VGWKISIEIFAVLVSYLIITLPLVGATEVSIFYGGTQSGDSIDLDFSEAAKKGLAINNPGSSAEIEFTVTNGSTDKEILETHLYICEGRGARVCVTQVDPVSFADDVSENYAWSDVRDGTSYPQTANFLTFVKVKRNGGVSWVGYWDVITRTNELNFALDSAEIDEIEIHAQSAPIIYSIRYFVENFFMIPMNTNWISSIVFKTATELRVMESNDPPNFWIETISGDELTSISNEYYFVFPKNSSGIMGLSSLNLNPYYTCGDDVCEGGDESELNCCYDCVCQTGYYCDPEMVCKSETSISLSLHGSPDTRVINCNEDHVIKIPVVVNNIPSDAVVKSARYSLGGDIQDTICKKGGGLFSCEINVPAVVDCDTGEYSVGPNSLTVVIEFSNGGSTKTKSMTVSFPDITIGSFECGGGVCESTLGEDQSNCCLDCGCPDGDYCDWEGVGSVPSDAACRDPLADSDLVMDSINPSHFYDQRYGGNSADIVVNINNKPISFQLDSLGCGMQCSSNRGDCQSTCDVAGCETDMTVSGIYSTQCLLSFSISNYDSLTDYDLSPVFTAGVSYNNGTSDTVIDSVINTFPTISIGAHWCGDFVCGDDEDYMMCCFDCGCPNGYYCDTNNINWPTSGDECKNKNFDLIIDDVANTLFQDSSVQHYLDITGHVSNFPSGTKITGECAIQGGAFECIMICDRVESIHTAEYNFTCQMIIPPVDYIGSPYFYPNQREIVLTQSMFSINHEYNEGSQNKTDVYDNNVDEIRLNVTTHCGEGGCEANFEETQSNCCRDCGCSNYGDYYFCYTGQNPSGLCLPNSSILLEITEFSPEPTECIIFQEGEECKITAVTVADIEIINPPSGVTLVDAFYSAGEQEDTPVDCRGTLKDNYYICPFALEDITIPEATTLGIVNVSVNIMGIINYQIGNFTVTQNIEGESTLDIKKVHSFALATCLGARQSIQDQIDSMEKTEGETNTYINIFMMLGNWHMSMFHETLDPVMFTLAKLCYAKAEEEIDKLEKQKEEEAALEQQMTEKMPMCDALTVPDLAALEEAGLTPIPSP